MNRAEFVTKPKLPEVRIACKKCGSGVDMESLWMYEDEMEELNSYFCKKCMIEAGLSTYRLYKEVERERD